MALTVSERPRLIVLFDRDCGICQASARAIGRWDRGDRLELLALQEAPDSARAAVAAVAGAHPLAAELHVLDPATGRVDRGGDAALAIAEALPGGSVVKPLRLIAPFRWVVGLLYDAVARNRHAIGRRLGVEGPACDVPR
jgi:predicted DCC family thiol-disulfide oxidoreductase YuxK